ncbi:Protein salvador homolog 1 [Strongyloides ratti]|uniref:Protein salvador homolog 1 n=1 Tax=Strongyloides ratti TaxID=34506 RepID=A0A090MZK5_STRRB|nr:Protein salvador homolog 1 [Strongyloides ratti]CEF69094.1 Protein salvador homolog 1 [Strongyloides ratti]
MPSWKKQNNPVPPYLIGTPGKYIRRESPPRFPTLDVNPKIKSNIPNIQLTKISDNNKTSHRSSTISETSSHPSQNITVPSIRGIQNTNGLKKSSHRFELSSHSFANHHPIHGGQKDNPCNKPTLTSSVSIGNVVQHSNENEYRPINHVQSQQALSLRSLPMINCNNNEELTLPANWSVEMTDEGLLYYVDHNNRVTHWVHPFARENLPYGWQKIFHPEHGVLYYNEYENITQIEHPGIAQDIDAIYESPSVQAIVQQPSAEKDEFIEEVSIINEEEVPQWLKLYATADTESDHLLNWNLFKLSQLDSFDGMLFKLFKQEILNVAQRYEKLRREINIELVNRRCDQH